ncbi:MAG: sodium:calcium antiporter [Deltaproteobacteria bacterium]|nr:sodium:calcium antiporter [Deltaproteobacteria bacterium]
MFLWFEFLVCAALIVVSGTKLSKYGDIIAEKTGMGKAWVGLILMASITSLPELMTGISSVTVADVPDIAVGDLVGACVFNLLILALLDPMDKSSPIFSKIGQSHLLSGGFGVLLLGLVSASVMLNRMVPSIWHIGLYTPVIILTYIAGIRTVYLYEKRGISRLVAEVSARKPYDHIPMKKAVAMYAANALVVIVVASVIPFIAARIAETTGLGSNFMGTLFVAATTTLPELVVSTSAMRLGAPDLAIGNLLGSNMFNIGLLALDDIIYAKGPLLSHVSESHAVTAIMAILMTAIALIGITYKHEKKAFLRFGWDSLSMLALGLLNAYFVYLMRGR